MGSPERDILQGRPEEDKDIKVLGETKLHFSPHFSDFAELQRAGPNLIKYTEVAIVQEIRRHPRLQKRIEDFAAKLGREIDLSKRRT